MNIAETPTSKFYGLFQYIFEYYNNTLFQNEIKDCIIVVIKKKNTFGHFAPKRYFNREDLDTDELALNPLMFTKFPLIEICQTIVHEMCHAWQYHYGNYPDNVYHNKEWSNKMQSVGLMPSRTGEVGGKDVGQTMGDYPIKDGIFLEATEVLMNSNVFAGLYLSVNPAIVDLLNDDEPIYEQIKDMISVQDITPTNIPIKVKYSCGCCNVWGSPNLDLSCNRCEELMKPKTY